MAEKEPGRSTRYEVFQYLKCVVFAELNYPQGPIADSMIRTIKKAGGILTSEDLASYKAIVLPALRATYNNRTYYVGHAPSGGPVLINLLNTLEGYKGFASSGRTGLAVHRFIEALKCASSGSKVTS